MGQNLTIRKEKLSIKIDRTLSTIKRTLLVLRMSGYLFTRGPFNTSLHSRDRGQERVEAKNIRVPQDTKLDSGMSESSYINVNVKNLDVNTQDSL